MKPTILNKIKNEKIVINKGNRVIYLNPVERVFNEGYGEVVYKYDIVFINKAKSIRISNFSFGYSCRSYSVNGYVSDLYVNIGLDFWKKNGEYVSPTLRGYNENELSAFCNFIEEAIFEELRIS